jgi:enoyl-CoA hydratase/carnithine racemase
MPLTTAETPILVAREGGVGTVTLNRPHAMNTITTGLARELNVAIRTLSGTCDVIVLRGAGGNFSAGGDFDELAVLRGEGAPAMRQLFEAFHGACNSIAAMPVPVIAAVEGTATGAGFELMLAADFAIVAEDAKLAHSNRTSAGPVPGGASQRLLRLAGAQRTLGMILTGDEITGTEAAQWGIAYRAVPAAEVDPAVAEIAARLARQDRAALRKSKELIYQGLKQPLSAKTSSQLDAALAYLASEDDASSIEALAQSE